MEIILVSKHDFVSKRVMLPVQLPSDDSLVIMFRYHVVCGTTPHPEHGAT